MRRRGPRRRSGRGAVAWALCSTVASMALAACQGQGDEPRAAPDPASTAASQGPFDLLADATPGDAPRLSYLRRRVLVRPDGERLRLPRRYDQVFELGERLVAAYDDRGDRRVDVLDAEGQVLQTRPLEADVVADPEGGLVAWASPAGELDLLWEDGGLSLGNQGGPVTARAVVGDPPCTPDEGDCRVYVDNREGLPPHWVAPDGSVAVAAAGAVSVRDVHRDGLLAVQLSSSDTGSCSGVLDEDGRRLWRTCDHSLFRFARDGRLLLASDPYLDGLGLASLSVLEARTGAVRATFTVEGGFIAQQVWEDDEHPLVVVSGPEGWEVLRLGLDGSRERALGPLPPDRDPTRPVVVLGGRR